MCSCIFECFCLQIKHTDKSEKVKVLAPGYLTPGKDVRNLLRKRKKKDLLSEQEVNISVPFNIIIHSYCFYSLIFTIKFQLH